METFTATELKQNSGKVLDTALQAPISIVKHGRTVAIMSSEPEYREFLKHREIQKKVQSGFAQIEDGEFSTRSMDDLFQEAVSRVEEKKKSAQDS